MVGVDSFFDFDSCCVDKVDVAGSVSVAYPPSGYIAMHNIGCRQAGHIDVHELQCVGRLAGSENCPIEGRARNLTHC